MTIKSLFLFFFTIGLCIGNNIIGQGTLFSQLDPLTQEQYRKMIKTKKYDKDNKDCNWTLFLKYNEDGTYNFVGFGDTIIEANEQELQNIEKAMNEDNIVFCSYYGNKTMIYNTKNNSSGEATRELATLIHKEREQIALEHAMWDSLEKKDRNPLSKIFHKIFDR